MRVLVTGSSGRIGSKVAERLALDMDVTGIDLCPGDYTTHVGNFTDASLLDSIMVDVQAVVHCAAYHAPHIGLVDDNLFQEVNVNGTERLLEKALAHRVNRFVYTSTTSVYGCTTRPKLEASWVTEQLEPNPEDIYDTTKLAAEELCEQASKSGLDTIVLRMSRCFPEPDFLQVFYRLYRGVDAKDVAEAHLLAIRSLSKGFHTFNISADTPFVKEDCKILLENPWDVIDQCFPKAKKLFQRKGWKLPGSIDRVYVIEKAKQMLHFKPTRNFEKILAIKTN